MPEVFCPDSFCLYFFSYEWGMFEMFLKTLDGDRDCNKTQVGGRLRESGRMKQSLYSIMII